jgi:hypothetical protein
LVRWLLGAGNTDALFLPPESCAGIYGVLMAHARQQLADAGVDAAR